MSDRSGDIERHTVDAARSATITDVKQTRSADIKEPYDSDI